LDGSGIMGVSGSASAASESVDRGLGMGERGADRRESWGLRCGGCGWG
jgi:hypothetical protein